MSEVANLSAKRNLFRDLAGTDVRMGIDVEVGADHCRCVLDRRFAAAEARQQYALAGLCRWSVQGVNVEIEMISWPDETRSVLYLRAGQSIHVFAPPGRYSFRYRFFDEPGVYDAVLTVQKEDAWGRLKLYAVKMWHLLGRGPQAWLAIAAVMRAQRDVVMATRTSHSTGMSITDTTSRPLLEAPTDPSTSSVSIIIPTRDRIDLLEPCITSLARVEGVDTEIIIVDNGTRDARTLDYLQLLDRHPNITVLRLDIPFNFSRLCNAGAESAKGDALLFLNDDVEALDGTWLAAMLVWLGDAKVGTVGARLLYPSYDLQHAGIASNLIPGPGHPWRGVSPAVWKAHPLICGAGEVDAVTGACLLVRRAEFQAVGGFNDDVFATTLNDVDLCLRLRQRGLKSVYVPEATLIHKEGQSRADDHSPGERQRRSRELRAFFDSYRDFARESCFYPPTLRRDSDQALPF